MNNLELWTKVEKTDPRMTKEVVIGSRKFTAIDPYYQIRNATEIFGSYGSRWGLKDITRDLTIMDERGYPVLLLSAVFYYPSGSFEISTSAKTVTGKTPKFDEDVFKKTETDLLTKALSKLGFNADVFTGKFDDNRYVSEAYHDAAAKEEMKVATDSQLEEIRGLMKLTSSDEGKMLAFVKVGKFEEITVPGYEKLKKALLAKKKKQDEEGRAA